MDVITDFVLAAAATPWVFLVLLAAIAIDGFFPPVPGEVILVAMGAAKAPAIRAAMAGRMVNGLITDEATARMLLPG